MDLVKQAIDIMRNFEGEEPYQLGYSGGKDSDVILHLAIKSGVKFNAVHNHTTVDAPETVYYVRKKVNRGLVKVEYPKESMWQLIVRLKTPPTRLYRYCCKYLKEYSGIGKKLVTGVRKYESRNRFENQGIITFTRPNSKVKEYVNGDEKRNTKTQTEGQFAIDGLENGSNNSNFHTTSRGGW